MPARSCCAVAWLLSNIPPLFSTGARTRDVARRITDPYWQGMMLSAKATRTAGLSWLREQLGMGTVDTQL